MVTPNLVAWQWEQYDLAHSTRQNLLLHAFTNPLFVGGVLFGVLRLSPWGLVPAVLAIVLQGRGHAREPNPPHPFRSPIDAVARIFLEQFVTFPRFVFSGRFARAMRQS